MKLNHVESSNIEAIGFTQGQQISLGRSNINVMRIQFINGESYDYYEIPKEVFDAFLASESKGKFFHASIKEKYVFEKVVK